MQCNGVVGVYWLVLVGGGGGGGYEDRRGGGGGGGYGGGGGGGGGRDFEEVPVPDAPPFKVRSTLSLVRYIRVWFFLNPVSYGSTLVTVFRDTGMVTNTCRHIH